MSYKSPLCINYDKLESLLSTEKYKEADRETNQLLERINSDERKKRREQYRRDPSIDESSFFTDKEDIKIIDQIWMQYSRGRFSFTKQYEIYRSCGGSNDFSRSRKKDRDALVKFFKEVGWYSSSLAIYGKPGGKSLTFSFDAPVGHLPSFAKRTKTELGVMDSVDTGEKKSTWDWGNIVERLT